MLELWKQWQKQKRFDYKNKGLHLQIRRSHLHLHLCCVGERKSFHSFNSFSQVQFFIPRSFTINNFNRTHFPISSTTSGSARDHLSLGCSRSLASASAASSTSTTPKTIIYKTSGSTMEDTPDAVMLPHSATIKLLSWERTLFDKVLDACQKLQLPCQVRVAGGWVRDKLLGLESVDIDFALDQLTGADFAQQVSAYLRSIDNNSASGVGIIRVNPDQSKHLETATFRIDNVSIDVNHFRQEIYQEDSRIPSATPSTAHEDALRRDFTMNALFYNIHTDCVEDSVNGVDDLFNHIVRTPRDPFKTFVDDPLRILRAARFAARFNFVVAEDIPNAASTPKIHQCLLEKVSRNRIGIETQKILLKSSSATMGFQLLCDWGLRPIIFKIHPKVITIPRKFVEAFDITHPLYPLDSTDEMDIKRVTDTMMQGMILAQDYCRTSANCSFCSHTFIKDQESRLLLAAFLLPYYGYSVMQKINRPISLANFVIRDSLALANRDADSCDQLHELAYGFLVCARMWKSMQSSTGEAAGEGKITDAEVIVRTADILRACGEDYPLVYYLSLIYIRVFSIPTSVIDESTFVSFIEWLRHSTDLIRCKVWETRSLMPGDRVKSALNITPGPQMKDAMVAMMEWQILNLARLSSTSKEQLEKEVLQHIQDSLSKGN